MLFWEPLILIFYLLFAALRHFLHVIANEMPGFVKGDFIRPPSIWDSFIRIDFLTLENRK